MKNFPMFVKTEGRRIVIVGGGESAAQKLRLALKTEADIEVAADTITPEIEALVQQGRVAGRSSAIDSDFFDNCAIAFVATGCPGADAAVSEIARASGALVNVVDQPDMSLAYTPSIVDRQPLVVAIGTEGAAPLLARMTKTAIEAMLEPRIGDLAAFCGRLRGRVKAMIPADRRRAFWAWAYGGSPRALFAAGREREAFREINMAIENEGVLPQEKSAPVSLVGAGPGGADLITMRGVRRLQEADIVFYDRLVDPEILELARRDCERVYVGKRPGAHAWPQDRINGLIVSAAKRGMRVVRLKCGDPGIFGRADEEISALDAAGLSYELVPGVTAASAAAAAIGRPLSRRGETDAIVLATAQRADGAAPAELGRCLKPGAAAAFYMGVGAAARIETALLDAGLAPNASVTIVSRAGHSGQKKLDVPLSDLKGVCQQSKDLAPAIIFADIPRETKRNVMPMREVRTA